MPPDTGTHSSWIPSRKAHPTHHACNDCKYVLCTDAMLKITAHNTGGGYEAQKAKDCRWRGSNSRPLDDPSVWPGQSDFRYETNALTNWATPTLRKIDLFTVHVGSFGQIISPFSGSRIVIRSRFALWSSYGNAAPRASTHDTSINSRRPRFTSPEGVDSLMFGWTGLRRLCFVRECEIW